MDIDAVPQEGNATLDGHSKLMYARDAQGRVVTTTSRGWEAEEIVTSHAVDVLVDEAQAAKAAREGRHRFRRSNTGCTSAAWTWRCCRRPAASGNGACAATCSRATSPRCRKPSWRATAKPGPARFHLARPAVNFQHQQAAHCESGVISSLMRHHGAPMTESMALGLSSALSFAYLPFIKLSGLPLISYRMPPKAIIKGLLAPMGRALQLRDLPHPRSRATAPSMRCWRAGRSSACRPRFIGCRTSRRTCAFTSTRTTCWCTEKTATTT
jgi:hypothetical protein